MTKATTPMPASNGPLCTAHVFADAVVFATGDGREFVARGKWFEFYCLLIDRRGDMIDALTLCDLKSWGTNSLDNGREVARHLQSIKVRKLQHPTIVSKKVTQEWALAPNWTVSFDAAATSDVSEILKPAALADDVLAVADGAEPMAWSLLAVDALLHFYSGDIQLAQTATAKALAAAPTDDTRAISLLMALRIDARLQSTDEVLDRLERNQESLDELPPSPLALHARQRSEVFRVLQAPPGDWTRLARRLDTAAVSGRYGVDPVAIAYTLNYAALTHRRLGHLEQAAQQIQRALVHAVAAGDLYLLQVVLFNAGLVLADLSAKASGAAASDAIAALHLVSRITRQHRIGNDSAQNELAIAAILIRQGALAEARRHLSEARAIIDKTTNVYDEAVLAHRELDFSVAERADVVRSAVFRKAVEACAALYHQADRADLAGKLKSQFHR